MYPILIGILKQRFSGAASGVWEQNNRAGAKVIKVILSPTYSWGGIVPVPGDL